jgi:hypothetical protein
MIDGKNGELPKHVIGETWSRQGGMCDRCTANLLREGWALDEAAATRGTCILLCPRCALRNTPAALGRLTPPAREL